MPILLLEHTGRKSGRKFTTPLAYVRQAEDIVVAASQGGAAENPQWYRNLRAHPEARVQIGTEYVAVVARVAEASERTDLWSMLVTAYSGFADYQSWTDREIPVVVLEQDRRSDPKS